MNLPEEPLNILYQDEWFVAVDKPAGQLVHPADVPQEDDNFQITSHYFTYLTTFSA